MLKKYIKIFVVCISLSSYLFAGSGYSMLKSTINSSKNMQDVIQLYSHLVNANIEFVSNECANSGEADCLVSKDNSFIVTQAMVDLQLRNFSGQLVSVGSSYPTPANFITFKNLPSGDAFDYSIKLDQTKVNDTGTLTFRWSENGDIKSASFKDTGLVVDITLKKNRDNLNTLLYRLNDSSQNDDFSYKIKLQQYNNNEGVKAKADVYYKQSNGYIYQFSMVAKADKNGGYVNSKYVFNNTIYEEIESFDGSGVQTGYQSRTNGGAWSVSTPLDTTYSIDNNDSALASSVSIGVTNSLATSQIQSTYVVVESGLTPNENNVLGNGSFFDDNNNSVIESNELFFDYFGKDDLLAPNGATSDNDQLDIYEIDVSTFEIKGSPTSGIWLTK